MHSSQMSIKKSFVFVSQKQNLITADPNEPDSSEFEEIKPRPHTQSSELFESRNM